MDFSHPYIMILNEVLKSNIALITFLSLTALLGWIYPYVWKTLGKKYSPLTLRIVDAIVVVSTLLAGVSLVERGRIERVIKDMKNMTLREYAVQIILGIIATGVGLTGTAIIQHHNIGKFQLHDYAVTILVSAIGVYIFMGQELTLQKIMGLVSIAIGGYVFSN
jgi:drug/metabolite transporter (DMT)-like permease